MSALVEFAIFPTDSTESKSPFVAKVLDMIDRSGLEYRLTPMGTIIEAESVGEIFELIEKAYEILGEDSSRIYSVIKVDYRKGPPGRIAKKKASVEKKLGRKLK
jgi:uncharacterized protein (TIGR00106 family)